MAFAKACVATVALLVACSGNALARPTAAEEVPAVANTSYCPHTLHRLATQQEFSGDWYVFVGLFQQNNSMQLTTPANTIPCFRLSYAMNGDRLSVVASVVINGVPAQERNFTYVQAPNGRWEDAVEVTYGVFYLGVSSDGTLLIMCGSSFLDPNNTEEVTSMVMGRSPHADEAALEALRSESYRNATVVRTNLQGCTASQSNDHDADLQNLDS